MRTHSLLRGILALLVLSVCAQQPSSTAIRDWQSRKYGMFIHFGLFSIPGGVWKGVQASGNYSEQIQSDAHIPEPEYAQLAQQFNPEKWDPEAIVKLAEDAGMKFIVITSKHHDGFSLFNTKLSSYNVVAATPYKRDIIASLATACARHHMPFGVYYSTIDWHFGDVPEPRNDNPISAVHEAFNTGQLRELMTGYGPISEIWFDMGHPTKLQSQHFAQTVHALQPDCLISGRVWNEQGDFMEMGDDEIPDYILDEPWEAPASIYADTWGYRSWEKRTDLPGKIREHVLRLAKVVSRGGNYILNIGPRGDGSVVEFEAGVLRGTGEWLKRNSDAIYGTQPQPFRKLDFGYATVKGNRLFLFVENVPKDGLLKLPGLQNRITRASLTGAPLKFENNSVFYTPYGRDVLPVVTVEFAGDLNVVQPTIPMSDGNINLTQETADRFFNSNGEGYWDPPRLRKEQWHFQTKKSGRYQVEVAYKPGKFARLLDVTIGKTILQANIKGADKGPLAIGDIQLASSPDLTLTVAPAEPAERGESLGVELEKVSLKLVAAQE
jgi:alpha-L-fucosidase